MTLTWALAKWHYPEKTRKQIWRRDERIYIQISFSAMLNLRYLYLNGDIKVVAEYVSFQFHTEVMTWSYTGSNMWRMISYTTRKISNLDKAPEEVFRNWKGQDPAMAHLKTARETGEREQNYHRSQWSGALQYLLRDRKWWEKSECWIWQSSD